MAIYSREKVHCFNVLLVYACIADCSVAQKGYVEIYNTVASYRDLGH